MEKYNILSKSIIEQAVLLECFGIYEYAWKKEEIEKVLEFLKNRKIPVLGGDVYQLKDEKILQTYDSWYINNTASATFYLESYKKAKDYIDEYESINEGDFLYALVFDIN